MDDNEWMAGGGLDLVLEHLMTCCRSKDNGKVVGFFKGIAEYLGWTLVYVEPGGGSSMSALMVDHSA